MTGWLVDSVDQCAEAVIEILRDPKEARTRALGGKEHVRRHFLTPRSYATGSPSSTSSSGTTSARRS